MKQSQKKREILDKVAGFVERMIATIKQFELGSRSSLRSELLKEIEQFDRSLGPGLSVGRLVSWAGPDGSEASYFVTAVGRSYVHLIWLPNLDQIESPVVVDGRAMRKAVQIALENQDWWRAVTDATRSKQAE